MANRLKDATSPYLLQHADNPVDWWPWCDEVFATATERDVPVLLSVGYAACHWCHVMAHESFEDPDTAAMINADFVAVKVDREERPDVDAVYMAVTQAMTGQGGWPMTVFLTPAAAPFFAGTYFPPAAFRELLAQVTAAWRDRRDGVLGQAGQIVAAFNRAASATKAGEPGGSGLAGGSATHAAGAAGVDTAALAGVCDQAVASLARDHDERHGGFGGTPKFPPSMVCEFLLRHSERPGDAPGGARALELVTATASAMAGGGMYDQLGGGFARYSVDARWVVPHFEKMLYDNALLARVYAHLWRRTGDPLARRVAAETCAWLLREMSTPEGGFAASLDADSAGGEGVFYTWTPAELSDVLGAADGAWAAELFGVTGDGTFEAGRSVLQLRAVPSDPARFAGVRERLMAARDRRQRPGRDDKVVSAWNGLAIAALAECGELLSEPTFTAAARGAAELLARTHITGGRLTRVSRDGVAGASAGALEDYACVAAGLLVLGGVTGDGRWVTLAGELLETALERFPDGHGGWYDTPDDGEALIYRPSDPADGPTPAGAAALAKALLSYAALTGSARHRDAAAAAVARLRPVAEQAPRAAGAVLAVAEALIAGPAEIAVIGPASDPRTAALRRAALLSAPPGAVLATGPGAGSSRPESAGPDSAGRESTGPESAGRESTGAAPVPLLAGRTTVAGAPAAYVCRGFFCRAPVTRPEELRGALGYPMVDVLG